MKCIVYSLLLLCLAISCKEKQQSKQFCYSKFKVQNIELSSIVDDIEYLPLRWEEPIKMVQKVCIVDSNVFVQALGMELLRFNKKGAFLNKIGVIGKGPQEYYSSSIFGVHSGAERVYIRNINSHVLSYSFDGKYMSEFKIGRVTYPSSIEELGSDKILFPMTNTNGNAKSNWVITDLDGRKLGEKKNHVSFNTPTTIAMSNAVVTYQYNNRLHYFEHFGDTIFSISEQGYRPEYTLEHDEYSYTPERFLKDFARWSSGTGKRVPCFRPMRFIETYRYLFIMYFGINKRQDIAIMDKESGEIFEQDPGQDNKGISNDVDGGLNCFPSYSFFENDNQYLVSWFFPYELKAHIASDVFKNSTPKYPKKKKALEELVNSLREDDNPVLMLVRLKE
ncbi:6-bladed beta-propeller [Puteibacter caeruleilacunae]|nr:6-bladed beta-propeller [Puteibacter caeruleilacunae]